MAFRRRGHEAYSCDIQEPSGGYPEYHILGDARIALAAGNIVTMDNENHYIEKWDLCICHPPCTDLAVSGARWFPEKQRDFRQQKSIVFFMEMLLANSSGIAIENPVGIMSTCYRKPDQIIEPYMFGDPYEKKTCLWLINLPKLIPTNIVKPHDRIKFESGRSVPDWVQDTWKLKASDRSKVRSKTYQGIAEAMADQWDFS